MHYGKKIKIARVTLDMTQAQLAKKVGLQQTALSKLEIGQREITVTQLMEFAKALNISPCDLLPDEEE